MQNKALNTALNKTANLIEHTSLGRFVFYGALLTAPLATSIAIMDLSVPDYDFNYTTTEQSTADRQAYTQQIASFQKQSDRIKVLGAMIPNQQNVDAATAMQEQRRNLYAELRTASIAFEADILTDLDLTENDFQSLAGIYNNFSRPNIHRYLQGNMAKALEECRNPIVNTTDTDKIGQANAIEQCQSDNNDPSVPLWILIFGLPIVSYIKLLKTGNRNDLNRTSMPKKTANFLREKAKKPKSH